MNTEYSPVPPAPIFCPVRSPDRRRGPADRRSPVTGGRRLRDPITDLATHAHANVTPQQLAPWWGVSIWTVLRWIHEGHPKYGYLTAAAHNGTREWVVLVPDALAFEARLFNPPV